MMKNGLLPGELLAEAPSVEDSSKSDPGSLFPILFGRRWPARRLAETVAAIDPNALCAEYAALREGAPRRSCAAKPYFVGHTGVASGKEVSNRYEEHCAMALVNLGRRWPRCDGGWLQLVDYQVPLKARQTDARIGKIDLLGLTDRGRLVIVELKVKRRSDGRSDSPPAALMEGLRYAAMVEGDFEAIANEAEDRFGAKIARTPPAVQLLAPASWWRRWLEVPSAGDWGSPFARLVRAVEERTGASIECLALEHLSLADGPNSRAPRLERVPAVYPVHPGHDPPIGEALACLPQTMIP